MPLATEGARQRKKYPSLSLLLPAPAGGSHWLNRSLRARDTLRQPMLARVLGTEPRGGGYRGAPGKEPSSQESCFPDFPHLVQVEIRHSKSQMKIQELYSPPGAYGVTKPQTQLHWLLSPSWSSFPKGNNTCPKSPPAMASSLNLQLPGADSKSQKRTDFSRERRGK